MSMPDLLLMELNLMEKTKHKTMDIIQLLLTEYEREAETTRKFLALVPEDKYDWAPHEKSMKMEFLATHLADIPNWVTLALTTDELDFAVTGFEPTSVNNTAEILAILEKSVAAGKAALENAKEEDLNGRWVLKNGDQVLADYSKYETIRHSLSQTSHHRAQLGVYLRLLNIPIPGSYGPSADSQSF